MLTTWITSRPCASPAMFGRPSTIDRGRAGCGESRTSGSEGGVGKRAERYCVRLLPYGKDAVDGAACLRLAYSRKMDEVLGFLGECWKDLGRPEQVPFDNARELA